MAWVLIVCMMLIQIPIDSFNAFAAFSFPEEHTVAMTTSGNAKKKSEFSKENSERKKTNLASSSDSTYNTASASSVPVIKKTFYYQKIFSNYIVTLFADEDILPDHVKVYIEMNDDVSIFEILEDRLPKDSNLEGVVAFDIKFFDGEEEIQPDGNIEIQIEKINQDNSAENLTKVFHIEEKGSLEEVDFKLINDTLISIMADSFSVYAIALISERAIPIYTVEDFMSMSSTGNYILKNDLDFSGINNYSGIFFEGTLDGDGYSIENFNISDGFVESTGEHINVTPGLFSMTSGATIKNLNIINSSIVFNGSNYNQDITEGGAFFDVGFITSYDSFGTIQNCNIENCTINISDAYGTHINGIGGLIGNANGSKITDCSFDGEISVNGFEGTYLYVGGIIGCTASSTATRCMNSADISISNTRSYNEIGGITGNSGKMEQCANSGNIEINEGSEPNHVGGLSSTIISALDCYNIGNIYVNSSNIPDYCTVSGCGDLAGVLKNVYSLGGIIIAHADQVKEKMHFGVVYTNASSRNVTTSNIYYLDSLLTNNFFYENGSDVAVSLSKQEIGNQSSYKGFDFDNVWKMGSGEYIFPVFQWLDICEEEPVIPETALIPIAPISGSTGVIFNSGYGLKLKFTSNNIIDSYDSNLGSLRVYEYNTDKCVFTAENYDINFVKEYSNNIVTVNISKFLGKADLKENTKYYVLIDEGFLSFDNADCYGINDKNEWVFTTEISNDKLRPVVRNEDEGINRAYNFDFEYRDSWFANSSYNYNHKLATWALSVAMAGFETYGEYKTGFLNAKTYLQQIGFGEFEANEGFKSKPTSESIGVAAATKELWINSQKYTLIVVPVRGAGYEDEWASNFFVNAYDIHSGFLSGASQIWEFLTNYIESKGINGNTIIMVTGFSRAAAVTNLVVAGLDNNPGRLGNIKLDRKNIYGFCFEPPATAKKTIDNFYDGKYKNIYNIINPIDIVPMVPLAQWGFSQYGVIYYLPAAGTTKNYPDYYKKFLENYKNITGKDYISDDFTIYKTDGFISGGGNIHEQYISNFMNRLSNIIPSNAKYVEILQESLTSIWSSEHDFELNHVLRIAFRLLGELAFDGNEDIATIINNLPIIIQPHLPSVSLAWMSSITDADGYANGIYRKLYINCPVDVKVYDSSNNLVALVEDNMPKKVENSCICSYIDENGQKIIILPTDENYIVKLMATDMGEVTFSIVEYDISIRRICRIVSYYNVGVSGGDELTGYVEKLEPNYEAEYPLYLKTGEKISKTLDQSDDDVTYYTVSVNSAGNGNVTGSGTYVNGEFAKIMAFADEGYQFIGWNINGTLVSKDAEYRFLVDQNTEIIGVFGRMSSNNNNSSHSGSSGDGSSLETTSGNDLLPPYVVRGTWDQLEDGNWMFTDSDGVLYKDTWAAIYNPYANTTIGQSKFDWFFFDSNGFMMTGWILDNGRKYYLNPVSDGTKGKMYVGWQIIDGQWYYFNTISDGTRGAMLTNTWIDNYYVNSDGIWNENTNQQ